MARIANIIIIMCLFAIYAIADIKAQDEARVIENLLRNYNKLALPRHNASTPLRVSMGMILNFIKELDEERQKLSIGTYFRLIWRDVNLRWNSSAFGGVKTIRIPPEHIWTPDVTAYNAHSFTLYGGSDEHISISAIVREDGRVLWVPAASITTPCPLDFTNFPFDTQVCRIKIGSWTHDSSELDLNYEDIQMYENFETNNKFKIVNSKIKRNSMKYSCCPEEFVDIDYLIYLERQSGYTLHLVIVPTVVICFILPAIFLLPVGAREKFSFGVGLMVTEAIMLLVLTDMLPGSTPSVPRLGTYHITTLILIAISLAITAFITMIWSKGVRGDSMPAFLDKIVSPLGKILFISRESVTAVGTYNTLELSTEAGGTDDSSPIIPEKRSAGAEWRQLAAILDRFCFLLFTAVCIIASLVFAFA